MEDEVVYQLSIEDLQNVAEDVIERSLTTDEIKKVTSIVEKRIPWYDIIEQAITEAIKS